MPAISYNPRHTVADYLGWEGDWELWDGTPVSMSPSPGFAHQKVAGNLYAALRDQIRGNKACRHCHPAYEIDWHIDAHTVVRPDLLVVCGPEPVDFVRSPPAFIAEILSPSTAEKDRTAKRELYALNKVSHYLLVDPDTRSVIHFTPDDGKGEEITTPVTLPLHDKCSRTIDPAALWA